MEDNEYTDLIHDLKQEVEALENELAEVSAERDDYKSLYENLCRIIDNAVDDLKEGL